MPNMTWDTYSGPITSEDTKRRAQSPSFSFISEHRPTDSFAALGMPHWAWLLIPMIAAGVPFLPGRFSVRTLLIATTLVAVLLGAIVYATR
jgi:hypothetical protein